MSVDQHLSAGGVVETGEEIDERAFAGAGPPDQGDGFARPDRQVNIGEDSFPLISESDVFKLNLARDSRQVGRVLSVNYCRLDIQNFEYPSG